MFIVPGIAIINNGWNKDINQEADTEENLIRFFNTKFKYLSKVILHNQLAGFEHIRLPNLVPIGDFSHVDKILNFDELKDYKDMLRTDFKTTFSFHVNYNCNNISMRNINYLINYYSKLLSVTDFLGIKKLHIVTHVNKNKKAEIIKVLKILESEVSKNLRQLLCFENSEHGFTIMECIDLSCVTGNPVILDNFHNEIKGKYTLNPVLLKRLKNTWADTCLIPKIHFSGGDIITHKHGREFNQNEFDRLIELFYNVNYTNLIVQVELLYAIESIVNMRYRETKYTWLPEMVIDYRR